METLNQPPISIRVDGDRVFVESEAHRREFRNLVVLSPNPKGVRKIIAVGESLGSLQQSSGAGSADAAALLAGAEEKTALDLQDFSPRLAGSFIGYLVQSLETGAPGTVRRKPSIRIEIAGYEAVADERRREFEETVRGLLGRQVLVNGVPARKRPWWHLPL